MAWLYDLRDTVQDVLEQVCQLPCTCATAEGGWDQRRCLPHRAHGALTGLYWFGTPNRRFLRPMRPRWTPVHTVLVAHDWQNQPDEFGFPRRVHNARACRIWCQDCGAIAPGGCYGASRQVQRGDRLAWFADFPWTFAGGRDRERYERACTWLLHRAFELAPRPADADPLADEEDLTRSEWENVELRRHESTR